MVEIELEDALPRISANDETFKVFEAWDESYAGWGGEQRPFIHVSDLEKIADALKRNTSLVQLNLSYCAIYDEGAIALAVGLKNSNITQLYLQDTEICAEGAKALGDALKENTTLKELDLENCDLSEEGAKALADALKQNSSLKKLNLSWSGIGVEGAKALADALKQNATLSELILKGCSYIGHYGLKALADALKQNSSLVQLDLTSIGIRAEGAEALLDALAKNTTLEVLKLRGSSTYISGIVNHIGYENLKIVRFLLRLNKLGRNILHLPKTVSAPCWKNLAYGPRDVLYFLLRERAPFLTESSNKRMKLSDGTATNLLRRNQMCVADTESSTNE